ncbi:cyclin-T1-3-like isoform X2 [Tripterygium wilfordii]|uniref:cyclin-T1-3-like isoform X2 n=1 Tax=Tripterygium wilfordii TaxID=458696 RepID=UPI0018F85D87|nr:cyclin-T1-3-like isoform X2 [Tripterygium wilfordii]XP_038704603.1 cyclin-T1-3-like isoform X2 [Tripterygium wilfordii]
MSFRPQVTIACAILLCHRFYVRQSHAKNDWQTIATVSMFVACKIEDVPQLLRNVIVVAYEILYKWDPSAAKRVRQKDFYEKQKELILIGERLLLGTIAFDLDVQLPYPPLVRALKKLNILSNVAKVAWNFVNDWLCTTLCLQFKPHYIAAGSLYLAAEVQKVKLPEEKGNIWWMEFEVSTKKLKEVIRHMIKLLKDDKKQTPLPKSKIVDQSSVSVGKQSTTSPESCISIGSVTESPSCNKSMVDKGGIGKSLTSGDMYVCAKEVLPYPTSSTSAGTAVEECDVESQPKTGGSDSLSGDKVISSNNMYRKIDPSRIREALKRKRSIQVAKKKVVEVMDAEIGSEAWIEKELENGIQLE